MATQATLRFLAKNEGSPGAHLYGMKRQLAKERPLPTSLAFDFLVSFLPRFQFYPFLLPFFLFVRSFTCSFVRSYAFVSSFVRPSFNRSFVSRTLFNHLRSLVRSSSQSYVRSLFKHSFARSLPSIRDLKQATAATATRPPPNKRFNE